METHYSVVAGLSEAINFATLAEAQDFAAAQREHGLTVRVFSIAADRDPIQV